MTTSAWGVWSVFFPAPGSNYPAHTAHPTHYLSSQSGLLKNNSAHTAYPTHYLSFKSGLLKNNSAHTASPTHYLSFKSGSQTLSNIRKPLKNPNYLIFVYNTRMSETVFALVEQPKM
jgi:hypothetical protein